MRARPVAHRHRDAEALLGVLLGPPPGLRDLDLVGLDEKRDARAGTLSGGQRRRLDVAVALVGRPELVFLDEPTTGFDPSARREAWTMIEGLKAEGTTVFLTTHYLDEAQHLADRVAILRQGEILAAGRPDELGQRGTGVSVVSFRLPDGVALEDVAARAGAPAERSGALVSLEVDDAQETLWKLTSSAREDGLRLEELEVRRPTLEDVFLELTGADHE